MERKGRFPLLFLQGGGKSSHFPGGGHTPGPVAGAFPRGPYKIFTIRHNGFMGSSAIRKNRGSERRSHWPLILPGTLRGDMVKVPVLQVSNDSDRSEGAKLPTQAVPPGSRCPTVPRLTSGQGHRYSLYARQNVTAQSQGRKG